MWRQLLRHIITDVSEKPYASIFRARSYLYSHNHENFKSNINSYTLSPVPATTPQLRRRDAKVGVRAVQSESP
jgi:hypothetical protein